MVAVFAATLFNLVVSQRIHFAEALLCSNNVAYFHVMAQYRYHTEATIKYMENNLDEFHHHKGVFSRFYANKSTKKVLEALKSSLLGQRERMGE